MQLSQWKNLYRVVLVLVHYELHAMQPYTASHDAYVSQIPGQFTHT